MGELIFFAVLILFSILESVARQRKQREEGGGGDGAPEPNSSRRDRRPERSGRASPRAGAERGEAAETMLPADLWEEIQGLASGRLPDSRPEPTRRPRKPGRTGRRLPEGPPRPTVPERGRASVARRPPTEEEAHTLERLDVEPTGDEIRSPEVGVDRWTPSTQGAHPIHGTHRDYGTDPSGRVTSELDWRPPVSGNPNAKRVRALLRGSGGTDALKQAVMLQEILGPPASMKDD